MLLNLFALQFLIKRLISQICEFYHLSEILLWQLQHRALTNKKHFSRGSREQLCCCWQSPLHLLWCNSVFINSEIAAEIYLPYLPCAVWPNCCTTLPFWALSKPPCFTMVTYIHESHTTVQSIKEHDSSGKMKKSDHDVNKGFFLSWLIGRFWLPKTCFTRSSWMTVWGYFRSRKSGVEEGQDFLETVRNLSRFWLSCGMQCEILPLHLSEKSPGCRAAFLSRFGFFSSQT